MLKFIFHTYALNEFIIYKFPEYTNKLATVAT